MSNFSLILHFPTSRSKYLASAIKLSKKFSGFVPGKTNEVSISLKELFEKWEYFNLLFWKVVDWQGMFIELNDFNYHSHTDKTRIFYRLQMAHNKFLWSEIDKLNELEQVYLGNKTIQPEIIEEMSESEINQMLDYYNIAKVNTDTRENEY